MRYRTIALVGLVPFATCAFADTFVWRPSDISADIRKDKGPLRLGQYLHLTQRLRKGEAGWTIMRIDIPERWSVHEVAARDDVARLHFADGRRFALTEDNIGALSFAILNDGVKTDEARGVVWSRYATD